MAKQREKAAARGKTAGQRRGIGAAKRAQPAPASSARPPAAPASSAPARPAAAHPASARTAPAQRDAETHARPRHWLFKTEPSSFSFDDLLRAPRRRTAWDGVRNHQARNFLRDDVRQGDLVLVYHSSAEPPLVAGLARVTVGARPDPTQFDPRDEHFDPKAQRASPTWIEVEIEALRPLDARVPLAALKSDLRLARMLVVQPGQRLSIQPVQPGEWRVVLELGGLDPDEFD